MGNDKCDALGGISGPDVCAFDTPEGGFTVQALSCDKNAFAQVQDAAFTKEDLATISRVTNSNALVTFALCTDSYRSGVLGIAPDALAKQHDSSLKLFRQKCGTSGMDKAKCDAVDKTAEENAPEKEHWIWEWFREMRTGIFFAAGAILLDRIFRKPTDKGGGQGLSSETPTTTVTAEDFKKLYADPMSAGALDFAAGSAPSAKTLIAPVAMPLGGAILVPAY
ncbi:MAG TPA: hypothetical protein VFX30_14395 [bacterium]|nr:hypothetical protein [bacterium]